MIGIELNGGTLNFRPGDPVEGVVRWSLDSPPSAVEVRLFWFTAGKGDRDVAVAQSLKTIPKAASGEKPFRFRLPHEPFSFSGRLITLTWALEAIVSGAQETALVEIVSSPSLCEVALPALGT